MKIALYHISMVMYKEDARDGTRLHLRFAQIVVRLGQALAATLFLCWANSDSIPIPPGCV
jgi:hypothetical protein